MPGEKGHIFREKAALWNEPFKVTMMFRRNGYTGEIISKEYRIIFDVCPMETIS